MATYGNGLKVNAGIASSQSRGSTGTTTVYTAPATGYGIVQIYTTNGSASNTYYWAVGGKQMITAISSTTASNWYSIYVGPGQNLDLVVTAYLSGGVSLTATGVELANS